MGSYKRRTNDYQLNKSAGNAIVYKSVTGEIEVKYDDIVSENPDFAEEDFLYLKNYSDEDYRKIENADHTERRYCYPLADLAEYVDLTNESIEEHVVLKELIEKLQVAKRSLTDVQKRRVRLFYFHRLTIREIAKLEGVYPMAVHQSIKAACKKLKKIFLKSGIQNPR